VSFLELVQSSSVTQDARLLSSAMLLLVMDWAVLLPNPVRVSPLFSSSFPLSPQRWKTWCCCCAQAIRVSDVLC
jgi:hypothetical protein